MFGMDEKKKKILTISVIIYAILLMLVVVMINFEKVTTFLEWFNSKLDVFTPIILGAIIAYLCTPLVKLFQNVILKKVKSNSLRRVLSILLSYLLLLTLIIVIAFMIIPQLITSIEDLVRKMTDGTYMNYALETINNIINSIFPNSDGTSEIINIDKINNIITNFFVSSEDLLQQALNVVITYASRIFTGVKNLFFGILLSVYFVISKENLYAQSKKIMCAVFSKKKCDSIIKWCRHADKTFGGFIVGKLLDAMFMICACSIAFSIAKIPYAVLVSVVIGVCNIIPFFGPFIGAIPSGLIILIANPSKFIIYVILLLIIQQFDANIVEPKIVGDRTGLSSLGVIVAIMIMSGYFGIIGMFFGVPIFAIIYSLIMNFIDKRLNKKQLTTDLADYYSESSIVDPRKETESFSSKLYHLIGKAAVSAEKKTVSFITAQRNKQKEKKALKSKKNACDASKQENEASDENKNDIE